PLLLRLERLRHEIDEEGFQFGEDGRSLGNARARVVLLHHRVVGSELPAPRRGVAPPPAQARSRPPAPAGSPPSRSWRAGPATAARSACASWSGVRRIRRAGRSG